MTFETLTRPVVLLLAASQGVALVAGVRGAAHRFACGATFLCPSIILGLCLSGMGPRIPRSGVGRLEVGFLLLNLASAVVSILLLRTSGRPPALFWTVWIANSLSCAMMIYLAFFFRLF